MRSGHTMQRRRVTFRLVALRLTLAPAIALLVIGLVFNAAYTHAFSLANGWWAVTQIVGGVGVGLALMFLLFFGSTRMGVGFTVWMCLVFCMLIAFLGMNEQALHERGRTSMCLVEDEAKEQVTEHNVGTNPGDPGTTTTRTEYHYQLRCPGGRPDSMVTNSSVAHTGSVIAVRWDPAGRVGTRPESETFSSRIAIQIALILGGAAVFFALLDGLLDLRRGAQPPGWKCEIFYNIAYRLR